MFRPLLRYAGIIVFLILVMGVLAILLYTGFGRYNPQVFRPEAAAVDSTDVGSSTGEASEISTDLPGRPAAEEPVAEHQVILPASEVPGVEEITGPLADIVGAKDIDQDDKLIKLIDLHVKAGDINKAEAVCRELLERNPERTNVRIRLSSLLTMQGRFNEACKESGAILEKDPDNFYAHLAMAEAFLKTGLPSLAVDHAKKAVSEAGHIPQTRKLLAQAYLAEGSSDEARTQFEELVLLTPNDIDVVLGLGTAYIQSGKDELAMSVFRKAEEMQPASSSVHMALGQLHLKSGAVDEAIASYRKVLSITPTHPVALNNLALLIHKHKNDLTEATRLAARAWQISPDAPSIADTLGWLSYHGGDHNRATVMLGYAVRKRPRDPEIRYHFAAALFARGLEEQALKQITIALSQGKDFEGTGDAKELLEKIKRGPQEKAE
ncbi:MAG: tetratricopeptide repeat protein [Kiritimatiellia bacterium]|jgi:Flp pilus assembly protein TadD|nr:tetratricopeptide repeat protein [Kiritimatiellia bacterium]